MYNYCDSSIQYKKPSNLEELTKKFFKVERDWCDSVRKTGYYFEIEASSERPSHVQEWKQKTWLFWSLFLVNFPGFRYPWIAIRLESISNTFYMHGWKLSRCVNENQLLIERAISHLCPRVEISNIISQSKLNEKLVFSRLIKVTSLTMFCVPLPTSGGCLCCSILFLHYRSWFRFFQSHQKPEMTFLDIRLGSLSLERMWVK